MAETKNDSSSSEEEEVQRARSQADEKRAIKLHNHLAVTLQRELDAESYDRFLRASRTYLPPGVLGRCKNVMDVFEKLYSEEKIHLGDYEKLREMLDISGRRDISETIVKEERKILKLLRRGKKVDRSRARNVGKPEALRPLEDIVGTQSDPKLQNLRGKPGKNRLLLKDTDGTLLDPKLQSLRDKSDRWQRACKRNLSIFVKTNAYRETKHWLLELNSVMALAGPGDGKSFILQQLSMDLADEGYLTLYLREPGDVEVNFVTDQKILFIFDDPFGGPYFLKDKMNQWFQKGDIYFQRFVNRDNVKFIFACRKVIWSDCEHALTTMNLFQNRVDVSSEKISPGEREQILRSHFSDRLCTTTMKEISQQTLLAFPECCRQVSTSEVDLSDRDSVLQMFKHPFKFLCTLVRTLRERPISDIWKYAVLVLVMLNKGELPAKQLDTSDQAFELILEKVLNACSVESNRPLGELKNCAESLCGTFLTQDSEGFKFHHDSIYEAVVAVYGERYPTHILEFCDPDFVLSVCRPAHFETNADRCVVVMLEMCYPKFVEILTHQVKNGNILAFHNPVVQDQVIQSVWIEYLQSSGFSDIFVLFATHDVFYHLAKYGALKILEHLCRLAVRLEYSEENNDHFFDGLIEPPLGGDDNDDDDDDIGRAFIGLAGGGYIRHVKLCLEQLDNTERTERLCRQLVSSAAADEYLAAVQMQVQQDPEVYLHGAVIEASGEGHTNVVKLLLKYVTDINVLGKGFLVALSNGYIEVVKLLLQHSLPADSISSGLKLTSIQGHTEHAQLLLQYDLSTSTLDSCIQTASLSGHTDIVQLLLQHDLSQDSLICSLQVASIGGHSDIVRFLLQNYAYKIDGKVNNVSRYEDAVGILQCKIPQDTFADSFTIASHEGQIAVVQIFLQFDLSTDALGDGLKEASKGGHFEVVQRLLQHKHYADALHKSLIAASLRGHVRVVEILLQSQLHADAFGDALISASMEGHIDIVKSLLKHHIPEEKLGTALIEASNKGHLEIKHFLQDSLTATLEGVVLCGGHAELAQYKDIGKLSAKPNMYGETLKEELKVFYGGKDPKMQKFLRDNVEIFVQFEHDIVDVRNEALSLRWDKVWQGDVQSLQRVLKYADPERIGELLILALAAGNVQVIQMLLKYDIQRIYIEECLSMASERGHVQAVQLLLKHDISTESLNYPLFTSAERGQTKIVKLLLQQNITREALSDAIESAAKRGHVEAVQLLLENDIPIEAVCVSLLYAALRGHVSVVRLIIKHHTDKIMLSDPLIMAALKGQVEVVELLLDHDITRKASSEALTKAANAGHVRVTQLLLERDITKITKNALSDSLVKAANRGHVKIVQLLLQHGIQVKALSDSLIIAASRGHAEVIQLLLQHDISAKSICKSLTMAVRRRRVQVVRMLLRDGDTQALYKWVNMRDWSVISVVQFLRQTASSDNESPANLLLQHLPQVALGKIALLASVQGRLDILKLLIQHSIPTDTPSDGLLVRILELCKRCDRDGDIGNGDDEVSEDDDDGDEDDEDEDDDDDDEILNDDGDDGNDIDDADYIKDSENDDDDDEDDEDNILYSHPSSIALIQACNSGHSDVVQLLLQYGSTAGVVQMGLIAASREGHTNTVKLLLEHGIPTNYFSEEVISYFLTEFPGTGDPVIPEIFPRDPFNICFVVASLCGHVDIVDLLLQHRILPVTLDAGLIAASEKGETDVVQLVLHQDITKDSLDTALIRALERGKWEVAQLLLQQDITGDTLEKGLVLASRKGNTPISRLILNHDICMNAVCKGLMAATTEGHTEIVELLNQYASFTDACDEGRLVILYDRTSNEIYREKANGEKYIDNGKQTHGHNLFRDTLSEALVLASTRGHLRIAQLFMQYNVHADAIGRGFISAVAQGHLEIVQLLVQHKLSEDILCEGFLEATGRQHVEAVQVLLEHNIPIDIVCKGLIRASTAGHAEVIQSLLQCNIPIDVLGKGLLNASQKGHTQAVQLLQEHDVPIDAMSKGLVQAAKKGHARIVRLLLHHSIPKDVQVTGLIRASENGHVEVAALLIENDLPTEALTHRLQHILNKRHTEVVKLLSEAAIRAENVKILQLLLKYNIPQELLSEGLIWALRRGRVEVVRLLMEYDLPISKELVWASKMGNAEVVGLLLSHCAILTNDLCEGLICASQLGHKQVVQLLLEHDVPADAMRNGLIAAAKTGHVEVVRLMLQQTFSTNVPSKKSVEASANMHIEDGWRDITGTYK